MYMYVLFCSFIFTFHYLTHCTRCSGSGYTSRWYHMSDGEHFCNACFDHMYRRYVSLNIFTLILALLQIDISP